MFITPNKSSGQDLNIYVVGFFYRSSHKARQREPDSFEYAVYCFAVRGNLSLGSTNPFCLDMYLLLQGETVLFNIAYSKHACIYSKDDPVSVFKRSLYEDLHKE